MRDAFFSKIEERLRPLVSVIIVNITFIVLWNLGVLPSLLFFLIEVVLLYYTWKASTYYLDKNTKKNDRKDTQLKIDSYDEWKTKHPELLGPVEAENWRLYDKYKKQV